MKRFGVITIILIFIVASLACQISGGPKPPRTLAISQAESKAFEQALTKAQLDLQTGFVSVVLTETQVSSYITYNMTPEFSKYLRNPLVYFETNQIHIYGTYLGEAVEVDGRIILDVSVVNQAPKFSIVAAEFGPVPVPSFILNTLTEQLDKEVAKALAKNTTGYQLEKITLATGTLTITMKKK